MSQRNDTATHPTGLSADEAALEKRLQEQFLDAQPGTVIEIPAGRHALDRVLTLRANGVTIRGAAAYIDSTYRHYTASYGIDLSGQPTAVPLWSAAGGLDYLWRGVASGDVDFTLQHAYLGGFRCNADSPAQKERLSIPPLQDGRGDQPHRCTACLDEPRARAGDGCRILEPPFRQPLCDRRADDQRHDARYALHQHHRAALLRRGSRRALLSRKESCT